MDQIINLRKIIENKSMPNLKDRIWIAYEIAETLQSLHNQNEIHNDIRLENFFFDQNFNLKKSSSRYSQKLNDIYAPQKLNLVPKNVSKYWVNLIIRQ